MSSEYDYIAAIHKLLDDPYWPGTLETGQVYQRFEDDSPLGTISVQITQDGDTWLQILQERDPHSMGFTMRFRMPMIGGGQSPRVRNALLILAEAIRLDNLTNPQQRWKPEQNKSEV